MAAPSIRDCYVTTDCPEIAEVARTYGAQIIDRPAYLAQDNSTTADTLLHAIGAIEQNGIDCSNGIALLQPTSPLRPVTLIESAIKAFQNTPCDSLITVSMSKLKLGKIVDGFFVADYTHGTASQDMPPCAYENGLLYLTRHDTLKRFGNVAGDRVLAFETETPFDSVDIDNEIDFQIGESLYHLIKDRLGY